MDKEGKNYLFVMATLAATIFCYTLIFSFAAQQLEADALTLLYIAMQILLGLFWYVDRERDFSSTSRIVRTAGIILGVVCIVYANIRYIERINIRFSAGSIDNFKSMLTFGFILPCFGARLLTIFLPGLTTTLKQTPHNS